MLDKFLNTAIEMGANMLEFEYDCGGLIVMAFRGATGVSIGSVESNTKECGRLIDDILVLRRKGTVKIGETVHHVSVFEYDSFGGSAFRIRLTKANGT
jgi:hypothetical protein